MLAPVCWLFKLLAASVVSHASDAQHNEARDSNLRESDVMNVFIKQSK